MPYGNGPIAMALGNGPIARQPIAMALAVLVTKEKRGRSDQSDPYGTIVLHCVAVCCSVLWCAAECCRVVQCGAVCCSKNCAEDTLHTHIHTYALSLFRARARSLFHTQALEWLRFVHSRQGRVYSTHQCTITARRLDRVLIPTTIYKCVAVCCGVLQYVALCCSVLQCVAVLAMCCPML